MARDTVASRDAVVGIVGAGPVGLACALRLASFGVRTVVLEAEPDLPAQGSKACCIQGDVVEIFDKIEVGQKIAEEGVSWRIGRTYVGGRELFHTEYHSNGGFSPWVNLSQYRTQQVLLERLTASSYSQVRWSHRVIGVAPDADGVTVQVAGQAGPEELRFAYLVACDGIHSNVRRLLDVPWTGYRHGDRFLIADIRAELPLAHERHFHYDPSFNRGRQLVMHAQPDHVWRIDWQLASDADIDAERRSGRLDQRIRAVIGEVPYEVRWLSTYRFNQRVVTQMRVGRVFLAGDAAHALPPYGARGMNSGIHDVDNLAWKLHLVLAGLADDTLLDTYHTERYAAARENLRVTENTIKFMVPPNPLRRWARNVVLRLAPAFTPLRGRVDSGQMSKPFVYRDSPVVRPTPDNPLVGSFAPDGPVVVAGRQTRLRALLGREFVGLYFADDQSDARRLARRALDPPPAIPFRLYLILPSGILPSRDEPDPVPELPETVTAVPDSPALRQTYQAGPADDAGHAGQADRAGPYRWYLVRPDSHIAVAARSGPPDLAAELRRAVGGSEGAG